MRDLPIFLLILAMLLLDAAAVVGTANRHPGQPIQISRMNECLIFSLALSQVALVGMWAGLGRTRMAIRLPIVVAVLAGWGQLIGILLGPRILDPWYFYRSSFLQFVVIAGFFAFAFGMSRITGSNRLVRISEATDMPNDAAKRQRFQFTLAEMMEVVAGCGATLAIAKCFFPPIEALPAVALKVYSVYVGVFVVSGAIAAWGALHIDFRVWRLGALAATAICFVFATVSMVPPVTPEVEIVIWPYLALVTGVLLVCRVCGYRIANKQRGRVALASEVCQCDRETASRDQ